MESVAAFIVFLIAASIVSVLAWMHKQVRRPLLIAFTLRVGAALYHSYMSPLPYSQRDAIVFEEKAWFFAQHSLSLTTLDSPTYVISWIISLLYRVTDRSPLAAQLLSVLFGTCAVYGAWVVTRSTWGERAAQTVGWIIALFPTLVLFSGLILREAYFWTFILVASWGAIRWASHPTLGNLFIASAGFVCAAAFHGVAAIGWLTLLVLTAIAELRKVLKSLFYAKVRTRSVIITTLALIPVVAYVNGAFVIPKIGAFRSSADVERLIYKMGFVTIHARDEVAYPFWLTPGSITESLWKAPLRFVYFWLSPLPWDLRKPQHLLLLFDGSLYFSLLIIMWRGRRQIWMNRKARWLLVLVVAMAAALSIGTGSFVDGARHRAKLLPLLVSIAGPALPTIMPRKSPFSQRQPESVTRKQVR